MLQMRRIEHQHDEAGTKDRHALLLSLRDKEFYMQANSLQLFNKRLQLLQENKTMEVRRLADALPMTGYMAEPVRGTA